MHLIVSISNFTMLLWQQDDVTIGPVSSSVSVDCLNLLAKLNKNQIRKALANGLTCNIVVL